MADATRKHRDARPTAEGGKGLHVIQRWAPVSDESARHAMAIATADVGGVIQQLAGTLPGFYLARQTGTGPSAWQRLADLNLETALQTSDFAAVVGAIHRVDGTATVTATMPASPAHNDTIGFMTYGPGGVLTVDFNGKQLVGAFATVAIQPESFAPRVFRFDAIDDFWILDSSLSDFAALREQSLATAPTITFDSLLGVNASVTLDQVGHALEFLRPQAQRGFLWVLQDGTGGRTIGSYSFPGGAVVFPGGVAPVLSTGANAVDVLEWQKQPNANVVLVRLHAADVS